MMDGPARDIEHLLAMAGEQSNEQRRTTVIQIGRPVDRFTT